MCRNNKSRKNKRRILILFCLALLIAAGRPAAVKAMSESNWAGTAGFGTCSSSSDFTKYPYAAAGSLTEAQVKALGISSDYYIKRTGSSSRVLSGVQIDAVSLYGAGSSNYYYRLAANSKGGIRVRYPGVYNYRGQQLDVVETVTDWSVSHADNSGELPNIVSVSKTVPGWIGATNRGIKSLDVRLEFFRAGTSVPVTVKSVFTNTDIDNCQFVCYASDGTITKKWSNAAMSSGTISAHSTLYYKNAENETVVKSLDENAYPDRMQERASFAFSGSAINMQYGRDNALIASQRGHNVSTYLQHNPAASRGWAGWGIGATMDMVRYADDGSCDKTVTLGTATGKTVSAGIGDTWTYNISYNVPYGDAGRYRSFEINDMIDECMHIDEIKIRDQAGADVTGSFAVTADNNNIRAVSKKTDSSDFYGNLYTMKVRVHLQKIDDEHYDAARTTAVFGNTAAFIHQTANGEMVTENTEDTAVSLSIPDDGSITKTVTDSDESETMSNTVSGPDEEWTYNVSYNVPQGIAGRYSRFEFIDPIDECLTVRDIRVMYGSTDVSGDFDISTDGSRVTAAAKYVNSDSFYGKTYNLKVTVSAENAAAAEKHGHFTDENRCVMRFSNTASVRHALAGGSDIIQDSETAATDVYVPRLSIVKKSSRSRASRGQIVRYRLAVSQSTENAVADNIIIRDTVSLQGVDLDASSIRVSDTAAGDITGACDISVSGNDFTVRTYRSLASDNSILVQYDVRISDEGLEGSFLENTAEADSSNAGTVRDTVSVAIGPQELSSTTRAVNTFNFRMAAPVITVQPEDAAVLTGNTASFETAAEGGGLRYQWYRSTDSGQTWTAVIGAVSVRYTTDTLDTSASGEQYRCMVTNGLGSVFSDSAVLTVSDTVSWDLGGDGLTSYGSGTATSAVKAVYNITTKHLSITGEGDIAPFRLGTLVPWFEYRDEIQSISFGPGVRATDLGSIFSDHTALVDPPVLPESVTSLDDTFRGCTRLTAMPVIPAGVTAMKNAFYGCTAMSTVTDMGNVSGLRDLNKAFYNCSSITSAPVLPAGVTDMQSAFYGCSNLTAMPEIPDSVVSIASAFRSCTNMTSASSLADVTGITDMTEIFYGCVKLTAMPQLPPAVEIMKSTFYNCVKMSEPAALPAAVTSLDSTFFNCRALTSFPAIPASVRTMYSCFRNCSELTAAPVFTVGESQNSKLTDMRYAFYGCSKMSSCSMIPYSVTNVSYTFYGCRALKGTIVARGTCGTYAKCFTDAATDAGCALIINYTQEGAHPRRRLPWQQQKAAPAISQWAYRSTEGPLRA